LSSGDPRAMAAVIAADRVQPVPCVLCERIRAPRKKTGLSMKSTSTISSSVAGCWLLTCAAPDAEARISGSAAAPTAGLHFTAQLLDRLRQQGVRIGFVTLHVGLDTFRPIEVEDFTEHKMHSEEIDLDAPTAELINETRKAGGRIIAVGTTSVRVLESVARFCAGRIEPYRGHTSLFITPGSPFQVVDAMITNFHLPRSTLLLLVSAFMGKELMERVYQEAIRERYRFYSFGDAMLLV